MTTFKNPALFIALLVMISCKTTLKHTPLNYPGVQMVTGSGGGMTGQVISYHLFENGTVFKSTGVVEKSYEHLGKISAVATAQIFANYRTLDMENINFKHPGNLYYFVERKQGDDSDKIIWGDSDYTVPKNAALFYSVLDHQLTQIKSK
ncbi:MAG: hypothetical protein HKN76_03095 [Saprospiraceae bacterium]|nr:hypothetical protein [Saprospiraceae bacterium]